MTLTPLRDGQIWLVRGQHVTFQIIKITPHDDAFDTLMQPYSWKQPGRRWLPMVFRYQVGRTGDYWHECSSDELPDIVRITDLITLLWDPIDQVG